MAKPKIDPLEKIVAFPTYIKKRYVMDKEKNKILSAIGTNAINVYLANEKV